jgi:hypothetical protein
MPEPIPAMKVIRRVSPVSRRSTTSHSVISDPNRCGYSALKTSAFQTCAWLRTGVTPGGLMGEVNAAVKEKGVVTDSV